jgi:multidrug efflux system membrane fusion protein
MKRQIKWALGAMLLIVLMAGALRGLVMRKQVQPVNTAAQIAAVELAAQDVTTAKTREIMQGLSVSGTLKAINSAFVKARVAGELQGLTVREGDSVKAGQELARIDATEYIARLQQTRQQADAARAQREISQRQYDNNKALVDQGFISKTALDTSLASLQAADATYRAALSAVEVTRKSVDDAVLKAPITGQVAQRLAQNGERLPIDARIVEIVDLSQLELEAALSAAESLTLKPGQLAELRIEGSTALIKARLTRINPSAQGGSRSVLAYLRIDNASAPDVVLRQGLFAQGQLGTTRTPLLSVPLQSVRTDKPAPYVQVIEDGRVLHKPVTLGVRGQLGEELMVAVEGVSENAVVLQGSVGVLREGITVRFTSPATVSPAVKP